MSMTDKVTLFIDKPEFKFSAAHFLILDSKRAERLHGHNYQVRLEIDLLPPKTQTDDLDRVGYTIGFREIKEILKTELEILDERVLFPKNNPEVQIKEHFGEIEVCFRNRRYLFPSEEVLCLPIQNTSVEEYSRYLTQRILGSLSKFQILSLRVTVAEAWGQAATYELKSPL